MARKFSAERKCLGGVTDLNMKEKSFMESNIIRDGTSVYEFTPDSKRNSMTWKHPHSPTIKKTQN